MKDGVLLGTADADHGIHPAAFSGGTVPDAHLIRTKQRQQSLGRYGGAGDQPVAFQLFRRRAVQERRKGCGTAYNDRCAGKGVRQIVAGVCQSVQYQLAAAQPEKDLKAVVRVPVPAAEQVDSVADLTSMEQISATFSEICSEICSVAPEEAAQAMVL